MTWVRQSALLLAAAMLSAAAAPVWQWSLPDGIAPPPVPADNAMSAAKVELGRRLFYDADLSRDGTLSCASCHVQRHGFADSVQSRPGVDGEPGRRNAPGLANVGWLSPLTHADPAEITLERQVITPVFGTHPVEMGMAGHEAEIGARFGRDNCYRRMFARAFPENNGQIDFANVARALASFERTLVSYGSPFDRRQLSEAARGGEALFKRDCAACHSGPRFTDLTFHRITPANPVNADQGLFEKTGLEADRGKFRTPSLRNVALTGPWWHDGTAQSLQEAISRHGRTRDAQETAQLIAFLEALTDPEFVSNPAFAMPERACGRRL